MAFFSDRLNSLSPAKKNLLAAGLIFVLTLAAYSNSFHADFHLDDSHQIVMNHHIRDLSNLPRFFTDIRFGTSSNHQMDFFRPLTTASFAISYAISGYNTWSYHFVSIALHLFNSVLVFLILRAVLRQAGRPDSYPLSLFASLAFALHPIQTGAVTYISGRAVLLASLLYLLAFYCFIRYRESGAGHGYAWAVAAPFLYLMGLLSKEMAVSLPAMLLLYDVFITFPRRGRTWRAAAYYIPFILALVFFLAVRMYLMGYATVPGEDYDVGHYLLSEAKALLMYVRLVFLPMNQNFDYVLPLTRAIDAKVILSILLCLLAATLFCLSRKKDPALGFFGLWFFIALAPESSFIPIKDIAVEYRLYLPSVGFISTLAIMAQRLITIGSVKKVFAVVILTLLIVLCVNRNRSFATELTLWSDVARKSPNSARAHGNLASALLVERRFREASVELQRSLESDPSGYENPIELMNLGISFYNQGYYKEAEGELKKVIAVYPRSAPEAYVFLGRIYAQTGRNKDSVDILLKGVSLDPNNDSAHHLLAEIYMEQGKTAEALTEALEAKRCSPKDFEITFALADIYYQNGMVDEARASAAEALSLAQDDMQRSMAQAFIDRLKGA